MRKSVAIIILYLEVTHGDLVLHFSLCVVHLLEEAVKGVYHNAWVLLATQHCVCLTSTYKSKKNITSVIQQLIYNSACMQFILM